jgi:hypothetical protein
MIAGMRALRSAIIVLLAAASGAALAQIYRWTDERGKTYFSSTPPPASDRSSRFAGTSANRSVHVAILPASSSSMWMRMMVSKSGSA